MEAHGTRDTNAQQHTSSLKKNCPARKRRQFNRARAGCQNTQKMRHPKKNGPPPTHADKTNHPAALKHLPRTRTKPPAQRRLLTSALYPQTTIYRRSPTDPLERFDHTDILHTWQLWHGNMHPMSPTKHLDWLENNQHVWWSTTSRWEEKEEKIR